MSLKLPVKHLYNFEKRCDAGLTEPLCQLIFPCLISPAAISKFNYSKKWGGGGRIVLKFYAKYLWNKHFAVSLQLKLMTRNDITLTNF